MDTYPTDASSELTRRERLLVAGLLVGVTLWIRFCEVVPRHPVPYLRSTKGTTS